MRRTRIIRGGRLLDIGRRDAPERDLLVVDGRIAEIGPPGLAAPEDAEAVDASDRLLMPGLVNAHTHAHSALAKGLCGDRWPLELLLSSSPALNRGRSVEDKHLCGLLNAVEMVRRGCTACFDMFAEFPVPSVEGVEAVGRAYHEVGLRAVLAPMIADKTLYEAIPGLVEALPDDLGREVAAIRAAPSEESLAVCRALYEHWPFDRDLLRPAIAPTIPLHCSDAFLRACRALSDEFSLAVQTHLAESRTQALAARARYGHSLTAHLAQIGFLSPRVGAAHAIWLDAEDVSILAGHGAAVVHNPLSNARLGAGLANVRAYRDAGITVGIGTDAASTSDSLNMFEATRWASYLSRLRFADHARWLGPDEVLRMATEGSAQAIGLADVTGRLEPGLAADIVFLDLGHIAYVPLNDIVRQLVFGESGSAVAGVMIHGELVLWGGRILTIDEPALRGKANDAAERLRATNAGSRALAEKLEDYIGAFCVAQSRRIGEHAVCLTC